LAFKDKSTLALYVSSFTSVSINIIAHYIDFTNILHYDEGTKFDLLVNVEQAYNSKLEIPYPLIHGTVGNVTGTDKIDEFIEGETEYVHKVVTYKPSSNYLYYDFARRPLGNVA